MTDQSAKNTQVSWQTMQRCSVFLIYISRPDIESVITLETYFFGVTRITSAWGEGITYILNGGAIVGWTHLVMPKMAITKRKIFVICSMIVGVATVAIGIIGILDAIF